MTPTNAGQSAKVQRNPADFSMSESEERKRDLLLRAAWINIVAGFDCRPAPRAAWDEAASGDLTPWKKVVAPIRAAVASAVFIGDQQLIDQTRDGVRAFCRELEADFLSLIPECQEESATQLALEETECQSEAEPMEMAFVAAPSPSAAESAVLPLERHYETLGKLIKRLRIAARETRPQMVARLIR